MKYVVLVGLLGYLIFSNVSNMDESRNLRSRSKVEEVDVEGWTAIFSFAVLKDCSTEIIMLFGSVGGYLIMANINNWLDKKEEEQKMNEAGEDSNDSSDEDGEPTEGAYDGLNLDSKASSATDKKDK